MAKLAISAKTTVYKLAKSYLDKPNVNRLHGFALQWFPAVGFNLAHVGELVFEKSHQIVKAAALATITGAKFGYRIMETIVQKEAIKRLNLVRQGGEDAPHGPRPASAFSMPEDQWNVMFLNACLSLQDHAIPDDAASAFLAKLELGNWRMGWMWHLEGNGRD